MGSLELIIGPMFSGKTSLLIDRYKEHNKEPTNKKKVILNKVFAINYDQDTRYGTNKISSHDGKEISCTSVNNLYELEYHNNSQKLNLSEYIFINEAQFFKDLKPWVLDKVENYNKNIILCGLDCDYKREKFGEIWDLIPHANKITKLSGTCTKCSSPSIYTHRIGIETEQEVIGINNYIPVCRTCYCSLNSRAILNTPNNDNYGLAYHVC